MKQMTYPVALDDPAVIARAPLPVVYEAACVALQQCADVDECKLWADKMSALQSYARQTGDDTLLNFAKRIKGRAVRQMGKILREIPAANGVRTDLGEAHPLSRKQAGEEAGLSPDQTKDAIRVAAITDAVFDEQIEAPDVPSINALAEQGTKKKPHNLEGVDAADHIIGTRLIGIIGYVLRESTRLDIEQGVRGIKPSEIDQFLLDIRQAAEILRRIYLSVEERTRQCIQVNS